MSFKVRILFVPCKDPACRYRVQKWHGWLYGWSSLWWWTVEGEKNFGFYPSEEEAMQYVRNVFPVLLETFSKYEAGEKAWKAEKKKLGKKRTIAIFTEKNPPK